jgi:hypothetical protein
MHAIDTTNTISPIHQARKRRRQFQDCTRCNVTCSLTKRPDMPEAWCETEICAISGHRKHSMKTVVWCRPCAEIDFGAYLWAA